MVEVRHLKKIYYTSILILAISSSKCKATRSVWTVVYWWCWPSEKNVDMFWVCTCESCGADDGQTHWSNHYVCNLRHGKGKSCRVWKITDLFIAHASVMIAL